MARPMLRLQCGCDVPFLEKTPPACPTHGPQRVVRTMAMPRPRFTGAVSGPTAKKTDVTPFVGKLIESES
jgi:hypothetical protein